MRLTLRNLLAFHHKMMSPSDQAAFQQLLDAAPRAKQLLNRCVELTRRSQLAAPALEQANEKHIADTVSKYLDFELPDDQLATFERAALESDEQLAEIVDCHHILADVAGDKLSPQAPAWRSRLVALPQRTVAPPPLPSAAADDEYALAPVADNSAGWDQPEPSKPESKKSDLEKQPVPQEAVAKVDVERAAVETLLHDSTDQAKYLIDDDDDDELSEEAARARVRRAQQPVTSGRVSAPARSAVAVVESPPPVAVAVAAVAPQLSAAASAALRLRHDEETTVDDSDPLIDVPHAGPQYELAIPLPWLVGGGVGGVVALGLLVWVVSAVFFSSPTVAAKGPLVYGVEASPSYATVEMEGTIMNTAGGEPGPDVGAMIITWPVGTTPHVRLTAVQVLEDLSNARQNPYNDQLVSAKVGEDGRFRMRMMDHAEFHVLIMSEKSQTSAPKTWGDAIKELQSQLDDPASVLGQRVYHYQRVSMPEEKRTTLDYTFEGDGKK